MEKHLHKPYSSERVTDLASKIIYHKKAYYQGRPEISDVDYDLLEESLRQIAPNHPVLSLVGSGGVEGANPKVVHDQPMLSLNKTYDLGDLLDWVEGHEVTGTLKVDGLSVSLVYQGGTLVLAKTRGSGREGEDVTAKLQWVGDAIPSLAEPLDLEIRGELYCKESSFLHLADEMVSLNLERPSSPRNIVAGVLGRKSFGELARYFNFFAFDVIGLQNVSTEMEKYNWLASSGFSLPEVRLLKTPGDVETYLNHVKGIMADGEIGCDGAVFSYNDLALHQALGSTAHHPRYKNSFKWQGETARSKIMRIDWATSRLGVVTPVAVIEPVVLSGATITNVTLHNAGHVKSYNLKTGDLIEIVRSGEVIPKFLFVVSPASGQVSLPSKCPSCGSLLVADDIRIRCIAARDCPAQMSGAILNWIRAVEIDDLSEKRLQSMIEAGLVKKIPDLYRISVEGLLTLPATKQKMAEKLWRHIQETKSVDLAKFLNGLGIEGTGLTSWEKILEHHKDLNSVLEMTEGDLIAIDGFAEKSAAQIVQGLKRNRPLVMELMELGVHPVAPKKVLLGEQKLAGMQIVITGALSKPRKEVESLIKAAGGKLSSAVSGATSVLVTNEQDSGSSKMKKARELGVPVWSEAELLKRLD
jgi:DNA ligase (NAD+)